MAQIKKINIKGVEYDLAGSGNSTTDTAYVDNKTLYIEEGTTASGGNGVLEIDLTPYMSQAEDATMFETLLFGQYLYSIEDNTKPYTAVETSFQSETLYNTLMNNEYDYIKFIVNADGMSISSPIYNLTEKVVLPGDVEDTVKTYSKPTVFRVFPPNMFKVDIMFFVAKLKNTEPTYYCGLRCILQNISN